MIAPSPILDHLKSVSVVVTEQIPKSEDDESGTDSSPGTDQDIGEGDELGHEDRDDQHYDDCRNEVVLKPVQGSVAYHVASPVLKGEDGQKRPTVMAGSCPCGCGGNHEVTSVRPYSWATARARDGDSPEWSTDREYISENEVEADGGVGS